MRSLEYLTGSVQGTAREENKDRVFLVERDNEIVAFVFDGISSAPEANQGIDIAINYIRSNEMKLFDRGLSLSGFLVEISDLISSSNLRTAYTTCSVVHVIPNENSIRYSNVGDSRIYEVTPQYIKQLTTDDNPADDKNLVTRYLGMLNLGKSEFADASTTIDEKRFLVCSDGFYNLLEKDISRFHDILNFRRKSTIEAALEKEIENKNSDDCTYILIL